MRISVETKDHGADQHGRRTAILVDGVERAAITWIDHHSSPGYGGWLLDQLATIAGREITEDELYRLQVDGETITV